MKVLYRNLADPPVARSPLAYSPPFQANNLPPSSILTLTGPNPKGKAQTLTYRSTDYFGAFSKEKRWERRAAVFDARVTCLARAPGLSRHTHVIAVRYSALNR